MWRVKKPRLSLCPYCYNGEMVLNKSEDILYCKVCFKIAKKEVTDQ